MKTLQGNPITLKSIPELAGDLWFRLRMARYSWPDRFQERAARRMPRWIVYRCTILAFSRAWHEAGDKTPDELTMEEIVKPWEEPRKPA